MNAENDTCELTEAELDLVTGGQPTHYEFGAAYGFDDLYWDLLAQRAVLSGVRRERRER